MEDPAQSANPADPAAHQVLAYSEQDVPQNVVVWCRLLAIIMFAMGVERLIFIGMTLFSIFSSMRRSQLTPLIAWLLLWFWPLCGLLLWIYAPVLARRVMKGTMAEGNRSATPQMGNEILCVGLILLGCYEINEGLPNIVATLINHPAGMRNLGDLDWRFMLTSLVRVGIGVVMLLGNHKIVERLKRPAADESHREEGEATPR